MHIYTHMDAHIKYTYVRADGQTNTNPPPDDYQNWNLLLRHATTITATHHNHYYHKNIRTKAHATTTTTTTTTSDNDDYNNIRNDIGGRSRTATFKPRRARPNKHPPHPEDTTK